MRLHHVLMDCHRGHEELRPHGHALDGQAKQISLTRFSVEARARRLISREIKSGVSS